MAKIPINAYHGSTAYLATIPIDDGNILYNSTTKEILVDENGTRIRYGGAIVVDTALSTTSTNPVQNRVITTEINTINTNLSNIASDVSDLQLELQSAEDSITNAFEVNAPIEKSPSTHNYAVGDYLIWNEGLRRVTSAISVGDALTNSNTTLTNSGKELSQINADLSDSKKWNFIGNLNSGGSLNLPSEFEEINFCFVILSGANMVESSMVAPYDILSSADRYYRTGYYANANSNASFSVLASRSRVTGLNVWQNGSDLTNTNNVACRVYYR